MISLRSKYWLILCGANGTVTLISAASHSPYVLVSAFIMTVICWRIANYLIEQDVAELIKKPEGGE